jgi:hypothetical protein
VPSRRRDASRRFEHSPHRGRSNQVKPVFDSDKEYSRIVGVLFDKIAEKNPRSAQVLLPPSYADDKLCSALQVADTLAYEARKLLTRKIRNPDDDYMRVPLIRLRPAIYRLYKLNYEAHSVRTVASTQSR